MGQAFELGQAFPHLQQVALGRVDFGVQVHLEAEYHIVGVKGMPVGKPEALPQFQGVMLSVCGNFPGLRKSRFCVLGRKVDMNQVGVQEAGEFFRDKVDGGDRI